MIQFLLVPLLGAALLGAARDEPEVIETVPAGSINWTRHTLQVVAGGVPRTQLVNMAAVRLDAEKSARAAVEMRLLDLVAALPLDGNTTAAAALAASSATAKRLPALLGDFRTVQTRYFSDGGVDLTVEVSWDGAIGELLLRGAVDPSAPVVERASESAPAEDAAYTGLVIHGAGLGLKPVLAPVLTDGAGAIFYAAGKVGLAGLRSRGAAGYVNSLDAAMRDPRVGDRPKVLRLVRVDANGRWVADPEDARDLPGLQGPLREGRVIAVVD